MPENVIAPWDYSGIFILGMLALDIFFVGLVWLWAWSGRTKREKKTPFNRSAENYGGTVQSGIAPIPPFLLVIYITILSFMIIYVANSIITGVKY